MLRSAGPEVSELLHGPTLALPHGDGQRILQHSQD